MGFYYRNSYTHTYAMATGYFKTHEYSYDYTTHICIYSKLDSFGCYHILT